MGVCRDASHGPAVAYSMESDTIGVKSSGEAEEDWSPGNLCFPFIRLPEFTRLLKSAAADAGNAMAVKTYQTLMHCVLLS